MRDFINIFYVTLGQYNFPSFIAKPIVFAINLMVPNTIDKKTTSFYKMLDRYHWALDYLIRRLSKRSKFQINFIYKLA